MDARVARRRVDAGAAKEDGREDEELGEEVEVVTSFDERGRPIKTGDAALMREDMRTRWGENFPYDCGSCWGLF